MKEKWNCPIICGYRSFSSAGLHSISIRSLLSLFFFVFECSPEKWKQMDFLTSFNLRAIKKFPRSDELVHLQMFLFSASADSRGSSAGRLLPINGNINMQHTNVGAFRLFLCFVNENGKERNNSRFSQFSFYRVNSFRSLPHNRNSLLLFFPPVQPAYRMQINNVFAAIKCFSQNFVLSASASAASI